MIKNPPTARETWVPSLGQEESPGGGHGNPLQYPCLENPMDRRAWRGYSPWGRTGHDWVTNTSAFISIRLAKYSWSSLSLSVCIYHLLRSFCPPTHSIHPPIWSAICLYLSVCLSVSPSIPLSVLFLRRTVNAVPAMWFWSHCILLLFWALDTFLK